MSTRIINYLDPLIGGGIKIVKDPEGNELPQRSTVKLTNITVVDNEETEELELSAPEGGTATVTLTLSEDSDALVAGDCYCSAGTSNPNEVTKATPEALQAAGSAIGVSDQAVSPGATFPRVDSVNATDTDLGAGAAAIVVVDEDARPARFELVDAAETAFIVGFCYEQGNFVRAPVPAKETTPKHVINVLRHGMKGTGDPDDPTVGDADDDAFDAIMAKVDELGVTSCEVHFPPLPTGRAYRQTRDWRIERQVRITGVNPQGASLGGSIIVQDNGASLVVEKNDGSPTNGPGDNCEIRGLCTRPFPPTGIAIYAQNQAVAKGAKKKLHHAWWMYLECIRAGTTNNDTSTDTAWSNGVRIKHGDFRRAITGSQHFVFVAGGTSYPIPKRGRRTGASEPSWTFTAGAVTVETGPDGNIEWTCYPLEPRFLFNGGEVPDVSVEWTTGLKTAYGFVARATDAACVTTPALNTLLYMRVGAFPGTPIVTSGSEPDWASTTTPGNTFVDANGITWQCIDGFDANGFANLVQDGTVVWAVKQLASLKIKAPCTVSHFTTKAETHSFWAGFSNANFYFGASISAWGDLFFLPATNTSGSRVSDCHFGRTGMGLFTRGGDANTCTFERLTGTGSDSGHISEVGILEGSFLGNTVKEVFLQAYFGYCFRLGAASNTGRGYGLYNEGSEGPMLVMGGFQLFGDTPGAGVQYYIESQVPQMAAGKMYNVAEATDSFDTNIETALVQQGAVYPRAYKLRAMLGGAYYHAWEWESVRTGWWTRMFADSAIYRSELLSDVTAAEGYPHKWFPYGFFMGTKSGPAPECFCFANREAWEYNYVFYAARQVNDILWDDGVLYVCTTAGSAAPEWQQNHQYLQGQPPPSYAAFPFDVVRPTAAYVAANPSVAGKIFKITDGGTSGTTEPDFVSALSSPVTQDGVEYTLLGDEAVLTPIAAADPGNQLPVVYPTTDSSTHTAWSYDIPENTAVDANIKVTAQKTTGADMAKFVLRGSWFRDGSDPATEHELPGGDGVALSVPNLAGTALTAILTLSTNQIRVRVTSPDGDDYDWKIEPTLSVVSQ